MKENWKRSSLVLWSVLGTLVLSLFIVACGGGHPTPSPNPTPAITILSPASLAVGSTPQTLTITGNGFINASTVTFNGVVHTSTYVSVSQLTISLTAPDLATVGNYPVVVTNPSPAGGTSTLTFSVWNSTTDATTGSAISYPPTWTYSDLVTPAGQSPEIGFAPPAKQIDPASEYVGDIVEAVIPNPSGDDLDGFYANVAEINFFNNSQSFSRFQVNGYSAVEFMSVAGMIPSDIIAIDKGQTVVEIRDLGQQHGSDGLLSQFAAGVR